MRGYSGEWVVFNDSVGLRTLCDTQTTPIPDHPLPCPSDLSTSLHGRAVSAESAAIHNARLLSRRSALFDSHIGAVATTTVWRPLKRLHPREIKFTLKICL